ncbi:hypothetical protein J2125_003624 [Erwinia toletana]|uniref:Holin n=1 Tax=Winslowiella toletana TaxID=92490 RepID=A0ABS4PCR1_9GAMM|nr:hypothetical protein [Winslowiella toletana]MBP2170432.1 hypothetical protein [Winslowiella toletana]
MSTIFIEYSGLWLVVGILSAGVISSQLLSSQPVVIRRLAGDLLRGGIVAIIIWAYFSSENCSLYYMIIMAGFSAVAWPHIIGEFIAIVVTSFKRFLPADRKE